MFSYMDRFSSDILLNVCSYLSVKEANHAMTCRRLVYIIDGLRDRMDPELIASSSLSVAEEGQARNQPQQSRPNKIRRITRQEVTPKQVIKGAVEKIRSRPNVAFLFYDSAKIDPNWRNDVEKLLPSDTAIISAGSDSGIQANCHGLVESSSNFSCMIGSFPDAKIVPIQFEASQECSSPEEEVQKILREARDPFHSNEKDDTCKDTYWKLFIVYVVGDGYGSHTATDLIQKLQMLHPHALIVGGFCDEGDIRLAPHVEVAQCKKFLQEKTTPGLRKLIVDALDEGAVEGLVHRSDYLTKASEVLAKSLLGTSSGRLEKVTDGVYGLAMGGDVPVLSTVSRGVSSIISPSMQGRDSMWSVSDAELTCLSNASLNGASEVDLVYSEALKQPIHVIKSVQHNDSGITLNGTEFLRSYNKFDYVGFKRVGGDGFELEHPVVVHEGAFYIQTDGSPESVESFKGAKIDLFEVEGNACIEDMDRKLTFLKQQLHGGKQLLGSIMFCSSGRGPMAGLLPEEMADAKKFAHCFPSVPCVGFYACGEIGPQAVAGNQLGCKRSKSLFQGYTTVFLAFVVPDGKPQKLIVNDCEENIAQHMKHRMSCDVKRYFQ